jgi:hypothetical protein
LAQRASAVGIDPQPAIAPSIAAMRDHRQVPASLVAIEERITAIDVDYYRHPAFRVAVSDDPALPPELSFVKG